MLYPTLFFIIQHYLNSMAGIVFIIILCKGEKKKKKRKENRPELDFMQEQWWTWAAGVYRITGAHGENFSDLNEGIVVAATS